MSETLLSPGTSFIFSEPGSASVRDVGVDPVDSRRNFLQRGRPVLCRSGRGSRLLLLRGGGGRVSRSSTMMSPTGRLASERSATV